MSTSTTPVPPRPTGRLFLWLGFGLAVLGVAAYVAQVSLQRLSIPWYMPVLAAAGAVLIGVSLWRKATVWRGVALAFVVMLMSAEIAMWFAVRLPAYEGPVAQGRPFPAFTTRRADGSPFSQGDLAGPQTTALVFFRGRW
jgi:hypothetical protein